MDGFRKPTSLQEINRGARKMNIYRIWFSDGNDRDEIGRVSASDIDQAVEYTLKQYFKPDLEYEEDGDSENLYLRINSCKYCGYNDLSDKDKVKLYKEQTGEKLKLKDAYMICENCETSEYIEICLDNGAEPEYKTIYGVNEYADLSTDTRPEPYNPTLVKAWNMDPQIGVKELMYQTINDNPKMCDAVDIEYLKEINKNHKEVISK